MSENGNVLDRAMPCPFCGSNKHFTSMTREYYEEPKRAVHNSAWIQCEECWITMWYFDHSTEKMTYEEAMERLIDKWNRRSEGEDDGVVADE